MRKVASLALLVMALAVAGCGGGDGGDASGSLDAALAYLPATTPFAVALETDGEQLDAADDLAGRVPFAGELRRRLREALRERAGDPDALEPALGNPFVVGSTDARAFLDSPRGRDTAFVGAIEVDDRDALDRLADGDGATAEGEVGGATVYEDDSGGAFAIDGAMLVVAGSRAELEAALRTREDGEGLTGAAFDAATAGVSDDALARVYLNAAELLQASPDARDALRSKWVAALRTGGIAVEVDDDDGGEIEIEVDVATDAAGLTDADVPIAPGPASPAILDRRGEVDLALRDPAHLLAFAQATATAAGGELADFEQSKAEVERDLKVDIDRDLIGQLDGDLAVSIGPGDRFGARAQLADPAAFRRALTRLEPAVPSFAQSFAGERVGFAKPQAGERFYAIATAGGDQVVFGVVGDVLVVSNSAAVAGALATSPTQTVPDAEGALVVRADARRLLRLVADAPAGEGGGDARGLLDSLGLGGLAEGRRGRGLGELTGSVEASTRGLSGSFTVATE